MLWQNGRRGGTLAWNCGMRKGIGLIAGGNRPWALSRAWERESGLGLIEVPSEDTKAWILGCKHKTHDRHGSMETFFKKHAAQEDSLAEYRKPSIKSLWGVFLGVKDESGVGSSRMEKHWYYWRGAGMGGAGVGDWSTPGSIRPPLCMCCHLSCSLCSCGLSHTFKNI